MTQSTLAKYYSVVLSIWDKKSEKALEIEEEIVFSDVINDSNGNDNSTTYTTWPEEATNTETNTAPADDIQQDKGNTQEEDKDKEEVESNEENEEESLGKLDSKN